MSVGAAPPGFALTCFLLPVEHTALPLNHIISSCSYAVRQEGNVAVHSEEFCVSKGDETVCNHQNSSPK